MVKTYAYGFPRIGKNREYKKTIESFWKNKIDTDELFSGIQNIEMENESIKLKLSEEALQKTLFLLNATGRMAKVGGWEIDVETLKTQWTEELYHIHEVGADYDSNVEKGISFYSPESRPIIEAAVQRAINYGEPFDLELQLLYLK